MDTNNQNNFEKDENRYQSEDEQRYNEWERMKKSPFFRNKSFFKGFLCTFLPFAIFTLLCYLADKSYGLIFPLILNLPYAVIGIVLWAVYLRRNRPLAFGLLLGCCIPAIVVFIATGGCGMMR